MAVFDVLSGRTTWQQAKDQLKKYREEAAKRKKKMEEEKKRKQREEQVKASARADVFRNLNSIKR